MAGCYVYGGRVAPVTCDDSLLSAEIDPSDRGRWRSYHRSRMPLYLLRFAIPSIVLQLRHRYRYKVSKLFAKFPFFLNSRSYEQEIRLKLVKGV